MTYPFERLEPDSFQRFCQALLSRTFPNTQCFPVGQADGGRDAISPSGGTDQRGFILYQVKFSRDASEESLSRKRLESTITKELPKIAKQIALGATQFVLMTNIRGTAKARSGSIDRVQALLDDSLTIPGICWWRDDLARRLDSAWDLKWAYPQLMTGPDLIRALIEEGLGEDRLRRSTAIRVFVSDQYHNDEQVRFRQVELENKLLDLFVDVPIGLPPSADKRRAYLRRRLLHTGVNEYQRRSSVHEEDHVYDYQQQLSFHNGHTGIGAAAFLLDPVVQEQIPFLVLEGAPGQGKSTITQYVAQVHRIRLLGRTHQATSLPDNHRGGGVRLPIRVDLRDFATWLARKNPFASDDMELREEGWTPSFEAFLAALIRHHSGGSTFTVSDLQAVAQHTALLIILDGLDEVADITSRQAVVHDIERAVSRLKDICLSLQVIVTTRPAAFANSPGLSDTLFPYFQLEAISRQLIEEYTEKWLKARGITPRQSTDFRKILRTKLDQPHLRDLARNPMQLAILLSLIHTRGSALPDKRTALYQAYVDLFFSREAEKSVVVRENRELLIELHSYLAWSLQSEAEEERSNGRIAQERLIERLQRYLVRDGRDPGLVTQLFKGMVERVVALVSRVEGTFEFEVQPLREYFAARYLYETAPHSPPGDEQSDAKPDRFDVLARDFYWFNVTRFYAGCFSKGELAALVDRLEELVSDASYSLISHPRVLAATLLSDWVFSQSPKYVDRVVGLVIGGSGLRTLAAAGSRRFGRRGHDISLPSTCGREALVDKCFNRLVDMPAIDYAIELADLIEANSEPHEIDSRWKLEAPRLDDEQQARWLSYGMYLGSLSRTPGYELNDLFRSPWVDQQKLTTLMLAGRWKWLEESAEAAQATVDALLGHLVEAYDPVAGKSSILGRFARVLNTLSYTIAFMHPDPFPLRDVQRRIFGPRSRDDNGGSQDTKGSDVLESCAQFVQTARRLIQQPAALWASSLEPWDELIECGRGIWGERMLWYHLANVGAGVNSRDDDDLKRSDLFDSSTPLCQRVRYARLRAGNAVWWQRQFESVTSDREKVLALLVFLSWASGATIGKLLELVDAQLQTLAETDWSGIASTLRYRNALKIRRQHPIEAQLVATSGISHRTMAALTVRLPEDANLQALDDVFSEYDGSESMVLEFCMRLGLSQLAGGRGNQRDILHRIAILYRNTAFGDSSMFNIHADESKPLLNSAAAREVLLEPERYPTFLVRMAEARCTQDVSVRIVPVGRIATQKRWSC